MLVPSRPVCVLRQRDIIGGGGDEIAAFVNGGLIRVSNVCGWVGGEDLNVRLVVVVVVDEHACDGAGGTEDAGAKADGGVEDVLLEGFDLAG